MPSRPPRPITYPCVEDYNGNRCIINRGHDNQHQDVYGNHWKCSVAFCHTRLADGEICYRDRDHDGDCRPSNWTTPGERLMTKVAYQCVEDNGTYRCTLTQGHTHIGGKNHLTPQGASWKATPSLCNNSLSNRDHCRRDADHTGNCRGSLWDPVAHPDGTIVHSTTSPAKTAKTLPGTCVVEVQFLNRIFKHLAYVNLQRNTLEEREANRKLLNELAPLIDPKHSDK